MAESWARRLNLRKAADDQFCNLCLLPKKLTKDHIPTRGWGNNRLIKVRRINDEDYIKTRLPRTFQGGVYYETLCEDCNSKVLGGSVDHALADFAKICAGMADSERYSFNARIQPNAILRSILGHMVAARLHTERAETTDSLIREYLIDGKPLDPRIEVYVWRFLLKDELVIARDLLVGDATKGTYSGIMNVIKFYPMAVVVELDGSRKLDAVSLNEFSVIPPSEMLTVPIRFSTPFNPQFPEEAVEVNPKYIVLAGRGYSDGIEDA